MDVIKVNELYRESMRAIGKELQLPSPRLAWQFCDIVNQFRDDLTALMNEAGVDWTPLREAN